MTQHDTQIPTGSQIPIRESGNLKRVSCVSHPNNMRAITFHEASEHRTSIQDATDITTSTFRKKGGVSLDDGEPTSGIADYCCLKTLTSLGRIL